MRQGRLCHVEVAVDVCFKRTIPLLFREFFQTWLVLLVSRIVDQDVELAELGNRLFHCPPRELRFFQIAIDEVNLPAFSFDCLRRFQRIAFLLREICERYVSAFSGKQHSHCPPNAGVATCDERHLVFEFS
jgi:hypothetical protein